MNNRLPFHFYNTLEYLTFSKQSTIKQATVCIEGILKKSVQKESPNLNKKVNWRTHDVNFARKNSRDTIELGAVTFSAGWFGQGHEVGAYVITSLEIILTANFLD